MHTFAAETTNNITFYENFIGKYILLVAPLTTPKVVRASVACIYTKQMI